MTKEIVLVAAGLIVLILLLGVMRSRTPQRIRLIAKPLMTRVERETLGHLEAAVPGCRVHAQVAKGALLQPERGLDRSDRAHWRNKFSQKIVDFVLEDRMSGEVLALIELDDGTHNAERDRERDRMTAACGYLTIRVPGKARPTRDGLASTITSALAARHKDLSTPAAGAMRALASTVTYASQTERG